MTTTRFGNTVWTTTEFMAKLKDDGDELVIFTDGYCTLPTLAMPKHDLTAKLGEMSDPCTGSYPINYHRLKLHLKSELEKNITYHHNDSDKFRTHFMWKVVLPPDGKVYYSDEIVGGFGNKRKPDLYTTKRYTITEKVDMWTDELMKKLVLKDYGLIDYIPCAKHTPELWQMAINGREEFNTKYREEHEGRDYQSSSFLHYKLSDIPSHCRTKEVIKSVLDYNPYELCWLKCDFEIPLEWYVQCVTADSRTMRKVPRHYICDVLDLFVNDLSKLGNLFSHITIYDDMIADIEPYVLIYIKSGNDLCGLPHELRSSTMIMLACDMDIQNMRFSNLEKWTFPTLNYMHQKYPGCICIVKGKCELSSTPHHVRDRVKKLCKQVIVANNTTDEQVIADYTVLLETIAKQNRADYEAMRESD